MSNLQSRTEADCKAADAACDAISLLIEPREKDLGGFNVRRLLPFAKCRSVGPFVFFDHLGPATFAPGQGIDVRPHPHIGLATVTYLFSGEILHRDSLGNVQAIQPGAINLMLAGRGIVHSERTGAEIRAQGHNLHALQLWLALPAALQESEPAFYHTPAAAIPELRLDGAVVRIIMGEAFGVSSPVPTFSSTLYIEVQLAAGKHFMPPDAVAEYAIYIVSGGLQLKGQRLAPYHMAVIGGGDVVDIAATEDARFVIIGGDPLGQRFIDWNFVSTSRERIERARQDWLHNRFDKVPGETEFIPLPQV